jgi:DNA-binding IscR family transcriptional regulator
MKGKDGGYQVAKDPGKVTLAEVIRLFDGALAPTESVSRYFYESTPIEREKSLLKVFRELRDYLSERLESITLLDVAEEE